ncbi:MAG: hypothetical protein PHT69_00725 [Bacteroidales bacterium]|nr:hypothetical protein [Bacteroidales bacterium]
MKNVKIHTIKKTNKYLLIILIALVVPASLFSQASFDLPVFPFNETLSIFSSQQSEERIKEVNTLIFDNKVYLNIMINAVHEETYFAIERSLDGTNFENIGMFKCLPSESGSSNFSFVDSNPLGINSFYRIISINSNNNITNISTQLVARTNTSPVESVIEEIIYVSTK